MYSVKCRYMLSISMLRNEHGLSAALLHIGTYQIEKNSIEARFETSTTFNSPQKIIF